MKCGVCPKCGSEEVFRGRPVYPGAIPANEIALEGATQYICFNCGYTELYVATGKNLSDLREKFKKVQR